MGCGVCGVVLWCVTCGLWCCFVVYNMWIVMCTLWCVRCCFVVCNMWIVMCSGCLVVFTFSVVHMVLFCGVYCVFCKLCRMYNM